MSNDFLLDSYIENLTIRLCLYVFNMRVKFHVN